MGVAFRALVVAMLGVMVAVTVDGFELADRRVGGGDGADVGGRCPHRGGSGRNLTVMSTSPVVPAAMGLTMVKVAVPWPGRSAVLVVCESPTSVTSAAARES